MFVYIQIWLLYLCFFSYLENMIDHLLQYYPFMPHQPTNWNILMCAFCLCQMAQWTVRAVFIPSVMEKIFVPWLLYYSPWTLLIALYEWDFSSYVCLLSAKPILVFLILHFSVICTNWPANKGVWWLVLQNYSRAYYILIEEWVSAGTMIAGLNENVYTHMQTSKYCCVLTTNKY